MVKNVELYCFSPTGGTKKIAETFAYGLAEDVKYIDLLDRNVYQLETKSELVVVAIPVFGGRIPTLAAEKLKTLQGKGKKAVTLAVYGVRAFEDALVEVNDVLAYCGFQVIASAACIAQHSMLADVGKGRPDEQDQLEIRDFASKVAAKLESGSLDGVNVPGNRPYKEAMVVAKVPITKESCVGCSACVEVCPKSALHIEDGKAVTVAEDCMLCMACVSICPIKARELAPDHQAGIKERLGSFVEIHRENAFYL